MPHCYTAAAVSASRLNGVRTKAALLAWVLTLFDCWPCFARPHTTGLGWLSASCLVCCSKAAQRVATLMQEHFGMADLTPDSPRLFASLLPPEEKKVEALV